MNALDTFVPSGGRANDPSISRRDVKIVPRREAASGLGQASVLNTSRDQGAPVRREYAVVDYDTLRFRQHISANTVGGALPMKQETTAGWSERTRRRTELVVQERFWLLNKWQGQVLNVKEDSFEAQLFDLGQPSAIEQAEFSINELSPDGVALLRPGATFYWMIGYRDLRSRQRVRESVIWMGRGGRMSEQKFKASLDEVNKIWGTLEERAAPTTTTE